MPRYRPQARESTGGKPPPTPRHLRNRDVLLRKGQYFTAAALKRTRRQFLLGRLHRFMAPFLRAKFITGSRRWIYKRGKLVPCRRMPKGLSKCICTMVCGWLDESALQSLALCSVPHARICALISKVWFCTRFDDLRQLAGGALNAFAHTQEKHESPLARVHEPGGGVLLPPMRCSGVGIGPAHTYQELIHIPDDLHLPSANNRMYAHTHERKYISGGNYVFTNLPTHQ